MKSSSKKRHENFVRELQSPLQTPPKTNALKNKGVSVEDDAYTAEENFRAALEAKFDELFGALSEDD